LVAQGHSVRVLLWSDSTGSTTDGHDVAGVPATVITHSRPRGLFRLLATLPLFYGKVLRSLRTDSIDVVHCTHIMLLPLAYIAGKRLGASVIYDAYEYYMHDTRSHLPRALRWIVTLLGMLEDQLVKRIDGVLTVDSADGWLERRYRELNPMTTVLLNVPDTREPRGSAPTAPPRQFGDRPIVVFAGGMSDRKGLHCIVEALQEVAREHPDVLALFIGSFHGKARAKLAEEAGQADLQRNIEVIPWLPYDALLAQLAIADVALALYQPVPRYLLLGRGNGRKIFTYMQAGLPIVGPSFGDIAELILEEDVGLAVDTTDPEAIAAAVLRVLSSPEEARRFGENGRRAVRDRYNWATEEAKLLAVYSALEPS